MAKNCVGLDIGSGAIKAVQLRASGRGYRLVNFGIEPVPPQAIVDGSLMNTSAIADGIVSLFRQLKIRQKEVAIAISGHSVIIKKIAVPSMSHDELEEQIHWEAEHHIPFARGEVQIDHQVLDNNAATNQMEVLLVAAKREVVNDYAEAVREARLNPVVVDVAAFCLQNCFEAGYGRPAETVALLNVGASISSINVIDGGQSAFTRDVTIGGSAITDEIQRQLSVSFDEAEAFKCGGSTGDEVVPREVEEIVAQQAEIMAGEFQRSFDFYLATTAEQQIDRIYLSGGTARIPSLQRAIESRARVPVELLDAFRGVAVDGQAFDLNYVQSQAPMAAVAAGLALRAEGDSL